VLLTRLGVMFQATNPVRELPELARRAETLGLDELWMAEDCFLHSGPAAAAAALSVTERLAVGIGLLPVAVRNPAIAAMELATLANLFPDRIRVAFGHGVEAWMRQIGARPPDRLVMLEEVVRATRALLHDETVDTAGRFVTLRDVRLEQPPGTPPEILVGTTGERAMGIAARAADGLVVPEGTSEPAVRWARGLLGDGRLVVYSWLRIEDDAATAQAALSPVVERWRAAGNYPGLEARAGALEELAVVGSAQDCADAVRRRGEAGADAVVLVPAGGDAAGQVARFASEVLPLLRG